MDTLPWVVVVVYGLVTGLLLGRFRQERRALLAAMASMTAIGVVTWISAPDSIAGPSMAVGGVACWLAALLSRSRPAL